MPIPLMDQKKTPKELSEDWISRNKPNEGTITK